jgi:hypothetical protein
MLVPIIRAISKVGMPALAQGWARGVTLDGARRSGPARDGFVSLTTGGAAGLRASGRPRAASRHGGSRSHRPQWKTAAGGCRVLARSRAVERGWLPGSPRPGPVPQSPLPPKTVLAAGPQLFNGPNGPSGLPASSAGWKLRRRKDLRPGSRATTASSLPIAPLGSCHESTPKSTGNPSGEGVLPPLGGAGARLRSPAARNATPREGRGEVLRLHMPHLRFLTPTPVKAW